MARVRAVTFFAAIAVGIAITCESETNRYTAVAGDAGRRFNPPRENAIAAFVVGQVPGRLAK